MPQLDKVTFLSQFFWLCFFYLGFYFLILKFFLPKMSRILKLRKSKLSSSQENVTILHKENDKVRTNYETLLSNGFSTSRSAFNENFHRTDNWLNEVVVTTNQNHSKAMNKSFIYSFGEVSLSQNLILTQLKTFWSDKLFMLYLLDNLKNLESSKNLVSTKEKNFLSSFTGKSTKNLKLKNTNHTSNLYSKNKNFLDSKKALSTEKVKLKKKK